MRPLPPRSADSIHLGCRNVTNQLFPAVEITERKLSTPQRTRARAFTMEPHEKPPLFMKQLCKSVREFEWDLRCCRASSHARVCVCVATGSYHTHARRGDATLKLVCGHHFTCACAGSMKYLSSCRSCTSNSSSSSSSTPSSSSTINSSRSSTNSNSSQFHPDIISLVVPEGSGGRGQVGVDFHRGRFSVKALLLTS